MDLPTPFGTLRIILYEEEAPNACAKLREYIGEYEEATVRFDGNVELLTYKHRAHVPDNYDGDWTSFVAIRDESPDLVLGLDSEPEQGCTVVGRLDDESRAIIERLLGKKQKKSMISRLLSFEKKHYI